MPFKPVVVSGTRPTGHLHLGNYLGAVKQYVAMQEEYQQCYFFIADYHSLTTHPNPADLRQNVKTVLIEYLACGLDPDKITIYKQSDLPQIPELYLLLNMHAYLGELERVPTFKEKARTQPDNINAGLLTYPTLMAADILIHRGTLVPVGKDQEQHLELTRQYARRFNNTYGEELLPEPQPFNTGGDLIKVPSLNAQGKMSKSEDGEAAIFLSDSPEAIEKKLKRAPTATGAPQEGSPMPEGVANLFTLMELLSSESTVGEFRTAYNNGSIRYGDMKKQLTKDTIQYLEPIRARIEELEDKNDYLEDVLRTGAKKAAISANETLSELKEAVGI